MDDEKKIIIEDIFGDAGFAAAESANENVTQNAEPTETAEPTAEENTWCETPTDTDAAAPTETVAPTDDGATDADDINDGCGMLIDPLVAEIRELNDQVSELNDKYMRVAAELENTRRRAARDAESAVRNRAMSVVRNFLPVMDAIESALSHSPDDEGIIAMQRAMSSAFEACGVSRIVAVGEKLNPTLHNAIQVVDAPEAESGTIVMEMQPGYRLGDTVLRTAMVVVAK